MGLFDFLKIDKQTKTIQTETETFCNELVDGIPFGYKNAWFVFKNNDFNKVKKALRSHLKYQKTVSLEEGIKLGYDGYFALMRPVNEFVFLISSDGFRFIDKVKELSDELGEITFYATHRSNDFLMLNKFENGELTRGFQISDDGIIQNIGIPTEIATTIAERERENSLKSSFLQNDEEMRLHIEQQELLSFLRNEETLMEIAEVWTINPTKLNQHKINHCIEIYK
jgi:hypothetical protein